MFTIKERDRRAAAAEKRITEAADRIERYENKLEGARAQWATAKGELEWLKAMPVSDDPQTTLDVEG